MDGNAKNICGVNLGGWLLMEGYILHGRNIGESIFKKKLREMHGDKGVEEFERSFRDNFIREDDFRNIAKLGANVVRLPFNARLIEKEPFRYREEGLALLEKALGWGKKHGIGVILDLHAAPGAQNCDWHSDSSGKALLWERAEYLERTLELWDVVAERFRDADALVGYDVLNEPVLQTTKKQKRRLNILKEFYRDAVKRIQKHDRKHTIYLEGNLWAQQIDFLADLLENNVEISVHTYHPLEYTFNFHRFLSFPGKINGEQWNKSRLYAALEPYARFAEKNKTRIFVGEFGINWRGGHYGELQWLEGMLDAYEHFGFGYAYWTYKAIANSAFPDGIYQYLPNNKYVRREGPVYGFENYPEYWEKEKKELAAFWRTESYTLNKGIAGVLQKHLVKYTQR